MAEERLTLRLIGLKHKMAQAGVSEKGLEQRKAAAVNILDEWVEATGVVTAGCSWHFELKSIVEDAVEIGLLGETLEEPDE